MPNPSILDPSISSVNYDQHGKIIPLTDDCFARATTDEEAKCLRYFVSYCNHGTDSGQMRNPYSPWYEKNRDIPAIGKSLYSLREVSKESFEIYLVFLQTGLESARRNAERVAN